MASNPARTPLHSWHVAHRARLVDFAGWSMPVQYTSIVQEHQATRTAVGVFDISHMGRLRFDGPDAAAFLDRLLTRRVLGLRPGRIRYSLMTNQHGGILDDVLVYHLPDPDGEPFHLLVVNAGNREKIVSWIEQHQAEGDAAGYHVGFSDQTTQTAMIAVQGPRALETVGPLVEADLSGMKYYQAAVTRIVGHRGIASRTGYTGEDGCELVVPAAAAVEVCQQVMEAGKGWGAVPAGLGARDTLRLEAAMPLYGHELSEQINPYQAGLGFAVNLDHDFVGREPLGKLKETPHQQRRVGLELTGRRVPRQHCLILAGEEVIGEVTSGTFSPTLQRPIAMGYVPPASAKPGTELAIDIRGQRAAAQVVKLPFYTRP